jgi:hypothetical protein
MHALHVAISEVRIVLIETQKFVHILKATARPFHGHCILVEDTWLYDLNLKSAKKSRKVKTFFREISTFVDADFAEQFWVLGSSTVLRNTVREGVMIKLGGGGVIKFGVTLVW